MPSKQFWGVVVTASFATALTFTSLPEHWRMPVVFGAWFVTALSGGAWLDEHFRTRSLSPIEKRDKIDKIVRRGEALETLWTQNKHPKWRSRWWVRETFSFVKQHFTLSQFDHFSHDAASADEAHLIFKLQRAEPDGRAVADLLIARMLEALRTLRLRIRD